MIWTKNQEQVINELMKSRDKLIYLYSQLPITDFQDFPEDIPGLVAFRS